MLISISLALLVIVAGMLLLAKTNKDELGNVYKFVSYAIITCGIILIGYSFVSCIVKCQGGGCSNSSKASCSSSYHGGAEKCAKWGKNCSKSSRSNRSGCDRSKCAKTCDSSKSKCKKGRAWKEHKKIITDGEEETVDVKIETKE